MPIWKTYDYVCPKCGLRKDREVVDDAEKDDVFCGECSTPEESVRMTREHPAPVTFNTIVPTHTSSQKLKAGYQHKHVNRPATKTQVGVGGGVSPEHPKK